MAHPDPQFLPKPKLVVRKFSQALKPDPKQSLTAYFTFSKLVISLLVVTLFFSCKKTDVPELPEPEPVPYAPVLLQGNVQVEVKLVAASSALISWLPPIHNPKDTLSYSVYVQNARLVQRKRIEDFLVPSLDNGKTYQAKVVAHYPNGDSAVGTASFTTLGGTIFHIGQYKGKPHVLVAADMDGKIKWVFEGGPGDKLHSPVISGDTIYVFTHDDLYCLGISGGQVYWRKNMAYVPETDPVDDGSRILFLSDLRFHAINKSDGSVAWITQRYPLSKPMAPTHGNGMYFVGVNYTTIYAMDARTGNVRWQYNAPEQWWQSEPLVANNRLVVNSENQVYALDVSDGRLLWSFPVREPGVPVSNNGLVFSLRQQRSTHWM
ncbi:MAG: hypothetical protein EOP49_33615 [Sphingobacteriales bacterium]|nr:MAG: hypothetical protein EOP49_33615 [Sphingobacteriales bacterium]